MRMIGIGLFGFLLAGVALLLSTMNIVERGQSYLGDLSSGAELVFETSTTQIADGPHTATIKPAVSDKPIILSGLPAYQGVSFHLPLDARPASGYLQLDVTSQALAGVEGVLRISIDNAKRGEMLLRPGKARRSLQISLSPRDFARDQLVVSFSLQGRGPTSECSADKGFEAIVEIETTSAVFLTLDRPLETTRDRVAAWGNMARVAWSPDFSAEQQMIRVAAATQFKNHGTDAVMVVKRRQDALTPATMRRSIRKQEIVATSEEIASTTPQGSDANHGLRRFAKGTTWRIRHDIRSNADGVMPTNLKLALELGSQISGGRWSIVVTLNNRLVHQSVLAKTANSLNITVALPADMIAISNLIEVSAVTTENGSSGCGNDGDLLAELLPATRLIFGTDTLADPLRDIQNTLAPMDSLSISTLSTIAAIDANVISSLISQVTTTSHAIEASKAMANIIALTPNTPNFGAPSIKDMWLIHWDETKNDLVIAPVTAGQPINVTCPSILVLGQRVNLGQVAL